MEQNASYWINHLQLQPHPEGGYFKETFRSQTDITRMGKPGVKQACTSIYYLLEGDDFSGFHRIGSDEVWYFHKGAPLHIHAIAPDGIYTLYELSDTVTGSLSLVIPTGQWFAAEIPAKTGFVLVSCAVAPAFDFIEFEMAEKETLTGLCPQYAEVVGRLCKG